MAKTNNIKELIDLEFLQYRLCSKCDKNFKKAEHEEDNWLVFFKTNHGLQSKLFPPNDYRGFVGLEIHLEHKECNKDYGEEVKEEEPKQETEQKDK